MIALFNQLTGDRIGDDTNIQYFGDDGLGIGMGEDFGLFIKKDFYSGRSAPTITYGNTIPLNEHYASSFNQ